MRIDNPIRPADPVPAPQTAARPTAEPALAEPADRTELSVVAGRLADPAGHAERLARLREAVAAGTYHVDSAALSRAIVDDALKP